MINSDNFLITIPGIPIAFAFLYLLIRYPEISFALFLIAGVYKADPRLAFIQNYFDLTLSFGFLTVIGLIFRKIKTPSSKIVIPLPSTPLLIGYIYILLLSLLSLIYAPVTAYGTEKSARFITITSLAFFLPFFLFKKKNIAKTLNATKRFLYVFVLMALSIVISILHSGITPGKIGFADAFGGNYVIAGRAIGTALIILAFYFLESTNNKIIKLIYLTLITLMIFGIFITGARAPLMAVGVSFLVVYSINSIKFLDTKKISKKNILKIAALLGIVLFLLIRFSNYFSTVFYRLGILQASDHRGSVFLTAISERLELAEYAVNAMFRFPFGLGFGGFTQWYNGGNSGIQYLYPHNLFLELGAEGGLLGLLAILLLVIKSFFNVLSNSSLSPLQNKPLKDTLLGLLVFMVFNSTVSGELNDDRTLLALIGLIDAVRKIRQPNLNN